MEDLGRKGDQVPGTGNSVFVNWNLRFKIGKGVGEGGQSWRKGK